MAKNPEAERFVLAAGSTLALARRGLQDYVDAEERWFDGVYQAVTAGRNVTFAIQKIKSVDSGFSDWYAPHRAKLSDDPIASFMVDFRNRIEKEGEVFNPTGNIGHVKIQFDSIEKDGPPGATGFIVDGAGRPAWLVPQDDGTEKVVYKRVERQVGLWEMFYEGMPEGWTLSAMLRHYFVLLDEIVESARDRYC